MAGATVTIKVESESLVAGIKEARRRGRDLSPAFRDIGEHMLASVRQNFEDQGRPVRWPLIKPETLIARAGGKKKAHTKKGKLTARAQKIVSGAKILIDSARLMNSITYRAGQEAVEIGTNVIYAATHQFGRNKGRGAPIPARPFLVVQPEDEVYITEAIEGYLMEPMR